MNVASKIKLNNFDSLLGSDTSIVNVPLEKLHTFKNHPFKVLDDENMQELVDSIKENGVLSPAIVRETANGEYELISGHRRKHACELAGIREMPVLVQDLTDDEATIIMVDANIQREELLPSEKAYAYKMKLEALKRKPGRPSKKSAQLIQPKTSIETMAAEVGESRATVQRLIRLTYLNNELMEYVDNKELPLNVGVELSYLPFDEQKRVVAAIEDSELMPSIAMAKKFREYSEQDMLTRGVIDVIMKEVTDKPVAVKLTSRTKRLFPETYTRKDMSDLVERLVKEYFENGGE